MALDKENTLYLPIKQVYFDEIVAGTKKIEYREVKEGITAGRYLLKDARTKYALNPQVVTDFGREYFIDDIVNGAFPFLPKRYQYLSLAVGYTKELDTKLLIINDLCNIFCFIFSVLRIFFGAFAPTLSSLLSGRY